MQGADPIGAQEEWHFDKIYTWRLVIIKVELVFHFNFKEDEVECKGQELLDYIRKMFNEAVAEEDFSENCNLVRIKFIEEEVEPF